MKKMGALHHTCINAKLAGLLQNISFCNSPFLKFGNFKKLGMQGRNATVQIGAGEQPR
jgi:hypothetical protein